MGEGSRSFGRTRVRRRRVPPTAARRLEHQRRSGRGWRARSRMAALRRGIGRLIDSYAEGVIEQAEFEPRIAGLKTRMAQLKPRRQMVAEAAAAERELTLVMGQLEDFAAKVGRGLDQRDWSGRRAIIQAGVRRIEIDGDQVEVVFRVPPRRSPEGPITADSQPSSRQHCTDDRGTHLRLARPPAPVGQGLGAADRHHRDLDRPRHEPADGQKARQSIRLDYPNTL